MAQAALAFCASDRRHVASGIVVGAGPISIAQAPLETISGDHPIPRDRSALAPAQLFPILLSDVPGDDIASIGSGPCAPDPLTAADVEEILRDARLATKLPLALAAYLGAVRAGSLPETPKPGSIVFANVHTPVVGNNALALRAAEHAATVGGAAHGIQRVVLDQRPLRRCR